MYVMEVQEAELEFLLAGVNILEMAEVTEVMGMAARQHQTRTILIPIAKDKGQQREHGEHHLEPYIQEAEVVGPFPLLNIILDVAVPEAVETGQLAVTVEVLELPTQEAVLEETELVAVLKFQVVLVLYCFTFIKKEMNFMIVHQVYAMIDGIGTVQNVIVCDNYEEANRLARGVYGDKAAAVDCLQYPCAIGDRYHDGFFWRVQEDGTEKEIAYVPKQEQQVQRLTEENAELTMAMADMIGGAM